MKEKDRRKGEEELGVISEDGRMDEKDEGEKEGGRKKIVEREKKKSEKEKTKERGPRGRQRPTCLKSLKARSNVSPWKPATGPALAKPVGKYKPTPPSPPPERGKRGGGGKKKGEKGNNKRPGQIRYASG